MFAYMDKSKAKQILPLLYNIMLENMSTVIPKVMPQNDFISAVTVGLRAENRKVLIFKKSDKTIGFLQYFISKDGTVLRIEELQIKREYQMSGVFVSLIRYMLKEIPEKLKYIEAFAHVENTKSIQLQHMIGLSEIHCENGIVHMRGEYNKFKYKYIAKAR